MRVNDYERWADMKRQAYIKRRRLLASAKQEPYARGEIFERDGWVCQLCFKPINRRLKGRKSKAPSIDHIIPLALGGDDTPDNVQAAHFGCNSGKCNRVRQEVLSGRE
jgi:5-methylcytosine-specific restriction endonuclease McrA